MTAISAERTALAAGDMTTSAMTAADRDRTPTLVVYEDPRKGCDHPAEHREVESRDGEDVREPGSTETLVDRLIPLLGVAEHKGNEHRVDRLTPRHAACLSVSRNARKESIADPRAQALTCAKPRVEHRACADRCLHPRQQEPRLDDDRANRPTTRSELRAIASCRQQAVRDGDETPDKSHSFSDRPRRFLRSVVDERHHRARRRSKIDPTPTVVDEGQSLHARSPDRRLVEVDREHVWSEGIHGPSTHNRRLGHDKLSRSRHRLTDRFRRHELRVCRSDGFTESQASPEFRGCDRHEP
jgi:hypothetical protein